MPLAAPVLVRNTEGGPTVLSDLQSKEYVEWAGAGDPNGGDIQAVPDAFLNNVNFLRCVQRGILVVENPEDNPEVAAAIDRQNASWKARTERAKTEATAAIDQQANNDLVAVPCVGPACTDTVPVKEKQAADKPPLCSRHENLAPQYVRQDNVAGEDTKVTWMRVSLGAREKEQV